jgi:phage terminase large subunit
MFKRTTAINKLLKLNARIKIVQGGTSAGKTYGILPILINKAMTTPRLEISVVSESIPHLRRGAMKDFLKILQSTERLIPSSWHHTLLTYKFKNGSYIEFFSADQSDKLRGARRNILYINEANNVSFEAYQQLAIRTSNEVWLDFNPTTEFWAHTELMDDKDSEFLKLTYKDNEALPDSIRQEIEKAKERGKTNDYWANWWKVYGLGELGSLQGVVFTNWKQIDSIPEGARLEAYGLDFGFTNSPTALTEIWYYDGLYYLNEIIYQSGLMISELSDIMKQKEVIRNVMIYADSAEPRSIKDLRLRGWKVYEASKGGDSKIHGINKMQEENFMITKSSLNLIKEFRSYIWATSRDGKALNEPVKAYDHAIDGVRYYFQTKLKAHGKRFAI